MTPSLMSLRVMMFCWMLIVLINVCITAPNSPASRSDSFIDCMLQSLDSSITVCSDVMCLMFCEYGFAEENGCPVCRCLEPCLEVKCPPGSSCHPTHDGSTWVGRCIGHTGDSIWNYDRPDPNQYTVCSDVMCDMFCEYGFAEENGCPVCRCLDPCLKVKCPPGSSCHPTLDGSTWVGRCIEHTDDATTEGPGTDRACVDPADPGRCRAAIPKYFFNHVSGRCVQFLYGGCGGNSNRYDSEEDCKKRCLRQ